MNFVEKDGGFLIDNVVFLSVDGFDENYANLRFDKGEDMIYSKEKNRIISYPGEYDLSDVFIKAFSDKNDKLSFYVEYGNDKSFSIIQSPGVLDNEEVTEAKTIYYFDESVEKVLDKMEIESKRQKLERKLV